MILLRAAAIGLLAFGLHAQDSADLHVIHRIKNEVFKKSKVAEHLEMLTDRYGPRLTASSEYKAAAEWVSARFQEWGLANVHLEPWGPFGRSWSLKRFSLHMTSPRYATLVALPVTCETVNPQERKATTLVYPPIHEREIASLEFCRNE